MRIIFERQSNLLEYLELSEKVLIFAAENIADYVGTSRLHW